jgi:uncharacterized protein YegJ (DUF2314 family)
MPERTMRRFAIAFVLLIAATAGCRKTPADKVTMVAEDDPKMTAAIAQARSTVNTFLTALRSPKPSQASFSVKMAFTDGKNTEHMWLSDVTYDGRAFHGVVNNDAELVSNVRLGQQASVEPAQISDWMYVENGKLVGGYTLRVLRDAMTPQERADFDRSVPFVVD